MAETTQRNEHQLLIGGKWVDASDGTYEIVNPATEEIVGLAPNVERGGCPGRRCGREGGAAGVGSLVGRGPRAPHA